jgi:glutamine cyclotransferase
VVKSKVKTDKVDIIKDTEFFKKLKEIGVVKNEKPKKNLNKFLCIDESNYVNLLMIKKISRAV